MLALSACAGASESPVPSSSSQATSTAAEASASAAASASVVVGDGEEWLAYQWLDRGGEDGIFLARPDGSGYHQLARDMPGHELHPDWSPDGERIAFVHFTPADLSELWVVNADGSGLELLLSCELPCNSFGYPDWDADGGAIYFGQDANAPVGEPPTTFQVARLDLATGNVDVLLTREDGMTAEQPRVSPDGQRVVYTRFREPADSFAGSAIFVCDLEGGPEQRLTEWDTYSAYPDWSADDLIVFNTFDLGAFQDITTAVNLYTISPDGSQIQRLTDYGEFETRATQPRWSPDGSGIVYTQVQGEGFGTRSAAFLSLGGGESPWAGFDPIIATHPTLRPL